MATSVLKHLLFNENGTQRYIYEVDSDVQGHSYFESLEMALKYVKSLAFKAIEERMVDAEKDIEKYGHSRVDLTVP